MIIISHRGNLVGRVPQLENSPDYIDKAINSGFDVEIDVRWDNGIWLGHDIAQYPIDANWLLNRKDSLWVHIKDIRNSQPIINSGLRCFFHEQERHSLILNSQYVWTHDLSEAATFSIIPLLSKSDIGLYPNYIHVKGICTDYPYLLNKRV